MEVGYSPLRGEIIKARDLGYARTKDLQVVCPCYKESVFEIVRPLLDGRKTDYRAHRPAHRDAALL